MRKLIILFIFVALSSNANASGIPVVDVAKISQDMSHYIQQMANFTEQLSQGVVQGNQYTQMLNDYNQVLTEYGHYLDQLRSMQHFISSKNWDNLMAMKLPGWGSSANGMISGLDTSDSKFSDNLDAIMAVYSVKPQTVGDFSKYLKKIGITDTTLGGSYGRTQSRYDSYRGTLEAVARNEEISNQMRTEIVKNAAQVKSLGDKSDLATMQMMATQNNMMMQQLERQATIANMQLMKAEQMEGYRAAARADAMKRYYESIKRKQDQDWTTSDYKMTGI